ncbi:pyruvate kinase [Picrophilus oshimae]|uniref:Pyruvate kinase n=1 Tax=Picrophilus torridus (strain ATCC 700027 / DSM 9790 / JCM 10055 / NBRC 100828 / KAW 2/3) TaxID=1122961 RepID=Q6L281_PICTO|nr:pyruvate kinase [Picrophilus oshimae]AAT42921.1 pyruvate kinase [Picrophilus oshimae DSM 9789]
MSRTKLIATIGPASESMEIIKKMANLGLSCIRINTAHIENGYITKVAKMVDDVNKSEGTYIGLMVDLKGPELRTGKFKDGSFKIDYNKKYKISYNKNDNPDILINYNISDFIDDKTLIAMSDGKLRFSVDSVNGDIINVTSLDSGSLRDNSRVNVPGKLLRLGSLTDRDRMFIEEGIKNNVNFYALSFVQSRENINELQDYLFERNCDAQLISKIETKSGYDNIDEIARASDFIMVARGDLGVEMPLKEVTIAQKKIIDESRKYATPTIVATQMLESMVNNDSPTRAEVSDITNAIIDGTDALMLSEETAIGRYPVEAIGYLSSISDYVDSMEIKYKEPESFAFDKVAFAISKGLKMISDYTNVDSIVAFTRSGFTARLVSSMRPGKMIYSVVSSDFLARSLNLLKSVVPVKIDESMKSKEIYDILVDINRSNKIRPGKKVLVVSGSPYFVFGGTNEIRLVTMGKFIGRGYPVGNSFSGYYEPDGSGDIIILDKYIKNFDYKKYKCVIIKGNVSDTIKNLFYENKILLLYNTEFDAELNEKTFLNIDGDTGIITA